MQKMKSPIKRYQLHFTKKEKCCIVVKCGKYVIYKEINLTTINNSIIYIHRNKNININIVYRIYVYPRIMQNIVRKLTELRN